MNVHVPDDIRQKYSNFEFRGKPFNLKGRTLIEAINHATEIKHYYSFEEDFLWHSNCELPEWFIKK
jgi:hypothetical protein